MFPGETDIVQLTLSKIQTSQNLTWPSFILSVVYVFETPPLTKVQKVPNPEVEWHSMIHDNLSVCQKHKICLYLSIRA